MPTQTQLSEHDSRSTCSIPDSDALQKLWLALSRISGLGPVRTAALLERFESPEGIFGADAQQLFDAAPGMPEGVMREILAGPDLAWAESQQEQCFRHGGRILTFGDAAYPARLRTISSAPPVLFCMGPLNYDHFRPVGVVGTRHPTELGRHACRNLVQEWASQGVRIISGLAMGIDETAHQAALEVGGETVAVLGNGIDQFGENSRSGLFRQITERGLVVSEFPMGLVPSPQTFPRRNRIISGLSRAVVVAEAGTRSGALITASECLDQNRELLAMPGPAGWPNFSGCHQLLRQGAALCADPKDLYEACGWRLGLALALPGEPASHPIVALLHSESMGIEELSLRLGRPIAWLLAETARLEIQGQLRRLPGGIFAPI
jgi:DNA processing protein